MSNPHQPDHQPDEHPNPDAAPPPHRGWGGEYDSDTTAFIEFPPAGGHPTSPGEDPLAAPGHGYQPPDLAATGPLPTPGATTDPAATGAWTMPFAHGGTAGTAPDPGAHPGAAPGSGWATAAAMGQGAAATRGHDPAPAPPAEPAAPRPPKPEPDPGPATGAPPGQGDGGDGPWMAPATGAPHPADEPGGRTPADTVGAPTPVAREDAAANASDHPEVSYVLRVNGEDRPVSGAWIGESLLYVLRERLGLAGAKDGCSQGECGACSVQVDGRLVAACLVPAATVAGSEIRTVEGLSADGSLSDVQRALAASTAVQCGFCLPGMAMTVHDLLEGNHAPSELETREALSGNLCRCTGYRGVLDAVRAVVEERAALAERQQDAQADPGASHEEQHAASAQIPHQAGPPSGEVS